MLLLFSFVCTHQNLSSKCLFSFFILVPNNCSDFIRRFVESLLIIHTECNLNTAGQLAMTDRNNHRVLSNPLAHGLWYEQLIHPTLTSIEEHTSYKSII